MANPGRAWRAETGRSIVLEAGDERVELDPTFGGRLTSLVAGKRERLVATPAPGLELPSVGSGSFVMVPFVGRMRDGELRWRGRRVPLPPNLGRHAIHGALFDLPWVVDSATPLSARLSATFDPARWPFRGRVSQTVTLERGRLDLTVEVEAAETMPVAAGWHPWFRRDPGEEVHVLVDADAVLDTASDLIPSGELMPVTAVTDLRRGPSIAGRTLDNSYVGVRGPAVARWPDLELRMSFGPEIRTIVVYTPPGAFCIEPQTAWPDAIRLEEERAAQTGLAVVEAGGAFRAHTWWEWSANGG